jgi:GAF domain-containing protein
MPDRVLLIGSGMAVGWGVTSHDVGLGGALARAVTVRTGRGVDVDIIADPGMRMASALRLVRRTNLPRYDAVVATIGVNAALALTGISRWRREIAHLLSVLAEDARPDAGIFVVGIQPIRSIPVYDDAFGGIVNVHAARLNRMSERICSAGGRAHFVPTTAPPPAVPPRFRDGSTYQHWAQEIAAKLAPELDRARHFAAPEKASVDDTAASRIFLTEYAVVDSESQARFDEIIKQALTMLGGTGASFGIIEGDQIVIRARAGTVPEFVELAGSFAALTVATRGALIVADAAIDERFQSNPHVLGDPAIRHYAGFPVESSNGERVGVICVFGPRPKPNDSKLVEIVLRQLAIHIQDVLRPQGG